MSRTLIENLPNETFYEIFDYFDIYEIYVSFSNLNQRFQQLINSSSLLLKIKFDCLYVEETFTKNYQQIVHLNKNRIFSIQVPSSDYTYQIISSFNFDSSFTCLESIDFNVDEPKLLTLLIPKLMCLPRLFSLNINLESDQKDFGDIYQLIFKLPKLKYIKLAVEHSDQFDTTVSLPIATNQQISPIGHFIIDHECAFHDIFNIISYIPHVRHLKFVNLINKNERIEDIKPIMLSNLTHLSINADEISFNKFKTFIINLNSKLKVLSLTTLMEDIDYLDANLWEEFIVTHLPQLDQFYFKYSAHFEKNYKTEMYLGKRDQFISPFWINRKWVLQTEIECDDLIYSIHPYNKCKWYDYGRQDKLSKSIRLIIDNPYLEKWYRPIFLNQSINHALTVTQIYHLEIRTQLSIIILNEILHMLPEVNSLKISSLCASRVGYLTEEELDFSSFLSTKTQIRKIYLENITTMEEICVLNLICSSINHLQIDCIDYMHANILIRIILSEIRMKPDHSLRLLCVSVPSANDHMVKELEKLIVILDLVDFMVERVMDNIYLKWK
ncbi:unnamed protein product [Adineta steineri]|uniref:F-box domain-containing protein n=1 Tax=Adineta steineri TaxID=433720 RepID=A0A813VKT9_9BILA|nr:unnamed protein product [Adineta steineri]CAF3942190.1 unnamed protein product [Adineta steineri]